MGSNHSLTSMADSEAVFSSVGETNSEWKGGPDLYDFKIATISTN